MFSRFRPDLQPQVHLFGKLLDLTFTFVIWDFFTCTKSMKQSWLKWKKTKKQNLPRKIPKPLYIYKYV